MQIFNKGAHISGEENEEYPEDARTPKLHNCADDWWTHAMCVQASATSGRIVMRVAVVCRARSPDPNLSIIFIYVFWSALIEILDTAHS